MVLRRFINMERGAIWINAKAPQKGDDDDESSSHITWVIDDDPDCNRHCPYGYCHEGIIEIDFPLASHVDSMFFGGLGNTSGSC